MVDDDVAAAFSSLHGLLAMVKSGEFYEDYDHSLEVFDCAEKGFEIIRAHVYGETP